MEILNLIQQFYTLPQDEALKLTACFEEITIPKDQTFIEAGKIAPYIYFIKSGVCRIFYHKEAQEVILDFAFPGEAMLSLNSYIHNKKGYENIQAITECALYRIPSQVVQKLYLESLPIANWGRKIAELETLKIEARLMSKLFKSATESYEELLQKAPDITNYVKLGHIASYLGVTQVTLSRIRGKI